VNTFTHTAKQIGDLLGAGQGAAAEQMVDQLTEVETNLLEQAWDLAPGEGRHYLAILYNNIGANYQSVGMQAHRQQNRDGMTQAALGAERCHEKALDLYDMSAEDFLFFPPHTRFNKNLIFTFWGLGSVKYVLSKNAESQKYLLLCLRIKAEDEQAAAWQSDASHYLRLLDRKPVQIVVQAHDVMPNLLNPQLLHVKGELLEWDAYAKPLLKEYVVFFTDDDIARLETQGFRNGIALENHTLVLSSDASGDLRRPLRLVQVA
jgi:hypothetical protein